MHMPYIYIYTMYIYTYVPAQYRCIYIYIPETGWGVRGIGVEIRPIRATGERVGEFARSCCSTIRQHMSGYVSTRQHIS